MSGPICGSPAEILASCISFLCLLLCNLLSLFFLYQSLCLCAADLTEATLTAACSKLLSAHTREAAVNQLMAVGVVLASTGETQYCSLRG